MLDQLPQDVLRYHLLGMLDKSWTLTKVCRRLYELCRPLLLARASTVSYTGSYGHASVGRGLCLRRLSSELMRHYPSGRAVHHRIMLVKRALVNRDHGFISFLLEAIANIRDDLVVDISRCFGLELTRVAFDKALNRGKGLLSMIYYDRYVGFCPDPEVREWVRSQLSGYKLSRIEYLNKKRNAPRADA